MKVLFTAATLGALMLLTKAGYALPDADPTLKSSWKQELPAGTQRIGIADVTGDKKPRLLTLDGEGTLTVQKMGDSGPTKEDTIALGKNATQFAVGRFAKDKPAVIVVPGAVFYRDGDKYSRKEAATIKTVSGTVRYTDGTEQFIVFEEGGPPMGYGVDLGAAAPVKAGEELPEPSDNSYYKVVEPVLPDKMFEDRPFPAELKKGKIVRLFAPEKSKSLYGLIAWQGDTSHLALIKGSDIFPMTNSDMKPLWKSPKLTGKILDITMGPSVKDPKQNGVYVLSASGEDGKGRQLEFFTLE